MSRLLERLWKRRKRVDDVLEEVQFRFSPKRVERETSWRQERAAIQQEHIERGVLHSSMCLGALQAGALTYVGDLATCWVDCLFEIVKPGGIALDQWTVALLIEGGTTAANGWTRSPIREHMRDQQRYGLRGVKINTFDCKVGGIIKFKIADAIELRARDVNREWKNTRRVQGLRRREGVLLVVLTVVLTVVADRGVRWISQRWSGPPEPTNQPTSTPDHGPGR